MNWEKLGSERGGKPQWKSEGSRSRLSHPMPEHNYHPSPTMYCIIAWRVQYRVYRNRTSPALPCTAVFKMCINNRAERLRRHRIQRRQNACIPAGCQITFYCRRVGRIGLGFRQMIRSCRRSPPDDPCDTQSNFRLSSPHAPSRPCIIANVREATLEETRTEANTRDVNAHDQWETW